MAKPDLTPLLNYGAPHQRAKCCWCKSSLVPVLNDTVWRCPTSACFERQLKYAIITTAGKPPVPTYHFVPLPIQVSFIEEVLSQKYRRILFGGAAGGGKSHALRWLGHLLCLMLPNFKVLLLRRKYPQLENSHLIPVESEARALGADYGKTAKAVVYPNNSRFNFGHCAELGDETNYLSDEYDLILFDEMVTFAETQITMISSRARTSRKDWKPQVVGGTNPGGISASYCLAHYLFKNPDPVKYKRYNGNDYLYIPSTLDDNPYLDFDYEQNLNDMSDAEHRMYRYGDWTAIEGQYFKEWNPAIHTEQIEVDPKVERFCAIDWGYLAPGVCYWFACLTDGKLYLEDEYKFQETLAVDVAYEIAKRNRQRGIKVRYTVGGADMFNRSGQTGEDIAETFRRAGVPLRRANNDRVIGWQRVRHALRLDKDNIPWLRVNPATCPYFCRTFPLLISDDKNPEDIDGRCEDHAAEAVRYGLMSRPAPSRMGQYDYAALKGKAGELLYNACIDLRSQTR